MKLHKRVKKNELRYYFKKMFDGIFSEMKFEKNNELDDVELVKFIEKVVVDNEWKAVFSTAIKNVVRE